mmetsp:Transcript_20645/g.56375  ORF Transcript_20645/g.56375 Transcript_20645/m.56375 type:complete len:241 (+) Transcript_20645:30-752(+)
MRPTRSMRCSPSRPLHEFRSPPLPPFPNISSCKCALKASTSGMRRRISCTSSGRLACIRLTSRSLMLASAVASTSALRNFSACGMPMAWASAISATTQARVKTSHRASTAMTCWKPGSVAAKKPITSANLFSSHGMLLPSRSCGGSEFRNLGVLQGQIGCGCRRTGSSSPLGFAPQMLLCCEMERAQIQYVRCKRPLWRSHSISWSTQCVSRWALAANSGSSKASATMAATRSRKRLSQL